MQSIEIEAKTIEEAIAIACDKLRADEDSLHIEIIETAPGKLLSFFSDKKAKIRARRLHETSTGADTDGVSTLKTVLEGIVEKIHPEATVEMQNSNGEIVMNINVNGSGIFIGRHGQTLEALQYIMNRIRMNKCRNAPHIVVDSESYRTRHIDSLVSLAMRLSDKAKKRQGPVTTNPLNPGDRRIIHMTLKKDSELTTWSKGDGTMKKVIIAPRQ